MLNNNNTNNNHEHEIVNDEAFVNRGQDYENCFKVCYTINICTWCFNIHDYHYHQKDINILLPLS